MHSMLMLWKMGEPVDKNLWGELEPEEGMPACWTSID